ncbi:hypothetical protein BaRGS_00030866 [Batillaria attramentaria]|uniref:Uncharacterized protein n=1 Tax=Batillaria attramentaria TaxID=370345 RepID=A0ABD0JT60_9CAEN
MKQRTSSRTTTHSSCVVVHLHGNPTLSLRGSHLVSAHFRGCELLKTSVPLSKCQRYQSGSGCWLAVPVTTSPPPARAATDGSIL